MSLHPKLLLNPKAIFCAWMFLWAARLRLIPDYFQRTYELGYYSHESDTIAIPIAGNGILTILLTPVWAIVLWLLLRNSPAERRTWLAWNRKRWLLSSVWTVIFAAFASSAISGLPEDIHIGLPCNAIADVCWFFLWFALRAVVVSRLSGGNLQEPTEIAPATAPAPSA